VHDAPHREAAVKLDCVPFSGRTTLSGESFAPPVGSYVAGRQSMDIELSFPGSKRVVAQVGAHRIETDQPVELGGHDAAPAEDDRGHAEL
jgi:hypothetical protein